MKNLFFLSVILLTISCGTPPTKTTESQPETIWVNSFKVPCTGVAPMNCLQIQKGKTLQDDQWEFFYDNIEGFDYQAGFLYKLLVKIEELERENVPADASSLKYTLVEVVEKKQDTKLRINDIWAVENIQGTPFEMESTNPRAKHPMLEVHVADKKILGNDGCNQFFGKLEKLTDTAIQFGAIGGTKMACPDMEIPRKFTDGLAQTVRYKISDLKLYLFDEKGTEVLVFKKVD